MIRETSILLKENYKYELTIKNTAYLQVNAIEIINKSTFKFYIFF